METPPPLTDTPLREEDSTLKPTDVLQQPTAPPPPVTAGELAWGSSKWPWLTLAVVMVLASSALELFEDSGCTNCTEGVVMGGADVVAYTGLRAGSDCVMGKSAHAVEYGSAVFYFANESTAAA
jgi:hypothetical protein